MKNPEMLHKFKKCKITFMNKCTHRVSITKIAFLPEKNASEQFFQFWVYLFHVHFIIGINIFEKGLCI